VDANIKKWVVNPDPFLECPGRDIPVTPVSSFYKYLGIKIGVTSNSHFVSEVLEKQLSYLTSGPMKPQQRLYALRTHLFPSLLHPPTFVAIAKRFLRSLDVRI